MDDFVAFVIFVPPPWRVSAQAPVVEFPLVSFAPGEYVLELAVGSGSIVERSPLAFRVQ